MHPVFYVSLLKAYKAAPHRKPPPPPDIIDDDEEFDIEDILQHRQKGRKFSYLVKWVGYGQEYNSWEPEDCFTLTSSGNIGHVALLGKTVPKG